MTGQIIADDGLSWGATLALRYAMAHPDRARGLVYANAIKTEVGRYLRDQDVAALCRTLTVPALIVDGDRDVRPRSAVDSLARALPGARRVTLAGAGHNPWVERPEDFRDTVAGFLREL